MSKLARKTVTVLFADVVGSTSLGEARDPEAVRALMAAYFERASTVIARHGGTVEKYIGDAIMAVFGIPTAHEDDALRAVRAAGEIRVALAELNEELVDPISLRIGLNTGEVVVGEGHTLATGDAVNVASRLEQLAAAGEILIGEATHVLVRDAVIAEPVGSLELRGRTDPITAWRVVAVLPDVPGRARRFDTPLVGRDEELAMLQQAYGRALAHRSCHLFTILGAAGVGKSRLAGELQASLPGDPAVVVGRCLPYGEGITYWPLRDVVRAFGEVSALVGEPDEAVVRATVGDGHTSAAPEETAQAFRRLVEAAARKRPLLLVFEDIHWAERAFLDLVDHIADSARDAPILLLCLARPEVLDQNPGWSGGKLNATTILLEPLDTTLSEELLRELGGDKLDRTTRRTITDVAEGNPLFLEEIVAMVVDEGAEGAVPPTVQALLTARLELLSSEERDTLAAAAVAGRFFSADAVAAIAGAAAPHALPELERKDLIRSHDVPFAGSGGYRFRHVLIRDAAYEALPKAVRAELHVRLADWLARSAAAETRREADELIAWHLEQAHESRRQLGIVDSVLAGRAFAALVLVGHEALGRGDAPAAESLLERALALPTELDRKRVSVRFDLVAALLERGEPTRAEDVVARAGEEAAELGDEGLAARASVERLHVHFQSQPMLWVETAVATSRAALSTLESAGDEAGIARAWLVIVAHDYVSGRVRDLTVSLDNALRHARRSGARRHVGDLLVLAVRSLVFGPVHVDDALERCDVIAAEGGEEAVIHGVRAALHAMAGRPDDARREYGMGHALLEELGRTRLLAVQRYYAGLAELLAGDAVAAERELRLSARTLATMSDTGTLSTVAALLATTLQAQGRTDEARTWAQSSRRDAPTIDLMSQVQWRTALAGVSPAEAIELAEAAVAIAEQTEVTTLHADALMCLRDVLASAGRRADAETAARRAEALYRAKGHVVGLQRVAAPPLVTVGSGGT